MFDFLMKKNDKKKIQKIKMFICCHIFKIKNRQQNWTLQIVDEDPFWTGEPQKSLIFRVWRRHFFQGGAPATSLKWATLWGSCCLKTTLVVFVAKNCWFHQNTKKIGTTDENLDYEAVRKQKFLAEGPPPICCQFIILLKS